MQEPNSVIASILEKYKTNDRARALRFIAAGNTADGKVKPEELKTFLLALLAPDVINEQGPETRRTALHQAIANNQAWAIEILLKNNAKYDIEDKDHKTVLCLATECKNSTNKRLVFTKLAQDVTKKIMPTYTCVEGEIKDIVEAPAFATFKKAIHERANIKTDLIMEFIVSAYAYEEYLQADRKPSQTEENKQESAKAILKRFISLMVNFDAWKEGKDNFTLNYCGLMCNHMFYELMQYKPVINGYLYVCMVHLIRGDWNHQVIMINGKPDAISQDTVLCNIMRGDIYIGEDARNYLNGFHGFEIGIGADNTHPDFNDFVFGKAKLQKLLAQIKMAYQLEYKELNYRGIIYKFLLNYANQIIQENPNVAKAIFNLLQRSAPFNVEEKVKSIIEERKSTAIKDSTRATILPPPLKQPQQTVVDINKLAISSSKPRGK